MDRTPDDKWVKMATAVEMLADLSTRNAEPLMILGMVKDKPGQVVLASALTPARTVAVLLGVTELLMRQVAANESPERN